MRVALLKGQSQYGVLRDFVDEVAAGFVARGWETKILDFVDTFNVATDLERAITSAGPLDLVFSVNAFGDLRTDDGRYITDIAKAPHVLEYVDYPLNYAERFRNLSPNLAVLLVDHSHIRMVNALFGENRFAYLGFGPHGGLGEPVAMPATPDEWIMARPVSVFFAGTNYRPDKALWAQLPAQVRTIFEVATNLALSNDWISPLDAMDTVLASIGLDPRNSAHDQKIQTELQELRILTMLVQEQVRCERRQLFLNAARKVGLPLTVAGNQWDGVSGVDWRGPLEVSECLNLMRQSRLAFSLSGNFGEGSHERPLSAMLAGAAVSCDHTKFYENAFVPGHDLALFRWSSLEDDLARIAAMLEDHETLFAMAKAGHDVAAAAHRWDHRVDTIIDAGRAVAQKVDFANTLAA